MDWNLLAGARRHLIVNLAAVGFLLYRKRLFGVHGGRKAYDAERRHESLMRVIRLS